MMRFRTSAQGAQGLLIRGKLYRFFHFIGPCASCAAVCLGRQAPAVEFVTKRSFGRAVEQAAHDATGRDANTGKLTLAIAIRRRPNGLVGFDGDLIKVDFDLSQDAIMRLGDYWEFVNTNTPKHVRSRMSCHFSRNTIIFDATAEQVNDWREFLTNVLSDMTSYVGID